MATRASSSGCIPDVVGDLLLCVADAWRVPMAVAEIVSSGTRTGQPRFLPDTARLGPRLGISCKAFPDCFDAAVKRARAAPARAETFVAPCPRKPGRVALLTGFVLPDNVHCFLVCGCLDSKLAAVRPVAASSPKASFITLPSGRAAATIAPGDLASLLGAVRRRTEELTTTFREREWYRRTSLRHRDDLDALRNGAASLLEDPNGESAFFGALGGFPELKAIGHLEASCDGHGQGVLRDKWFAARKGDTFERLSRSTTGTRKIDVPLVGHLWDRWHRCLPGYLYDADAVGVLRRGGQPLKKYIDALAKYIGDADFVSIGRLGKRVARGSCDINPHCERKHSCRLFVQECDHPDAKKCPPCELNQSCRLLVQDCTKPDPKKCPKCKRKATCYFDAGKGALPNGWPGPWRLRLVAVDLLFVKSPLSESKAWTALQQTSSLLRSLQREKDDFEDSLLTGLPQLPERQQRYYLRYLLDHCRAMPNGYEKGVAFERLTNGLLRLVAGWFPGKRRTRTRTPDNELDLTVLVEPAIREAKYWFDIFGPKIFVECKNQPKRLSLATYKKKRISPVKKLRDAMRAKGVKLGLLLNTGHIQDKFWEEARKPDPPKTPETLVVLFDGADLNRIIDCPRDATAYFKQKVSDAAIGA